jgi:hypothetical protein
VEYVSRRGAEAQSWEEKISAQTIFTERHCEGRYLRRIAGMKSGIFSRGPSRCRLSWLRRGRGWCASFPLRVNMMLEGR